ASPRQAGDGESKVVERMRERGEQIGIRHRQRWREERLDLIESRGGGVQLRAIIARRFGDDGRMICRVRKDPASTCRLRDVPWRFRKRQIQIDAATLETKAILDAVR